MARCIPLDSIRVRLAGGNRCKAVLLLPPAGNVFPYYRLTTQVPAALTVLLAAVVLAPSGRLEELAMPTLAAGRIFLSVAITHATKASGIVKSGDGKRRTGRTPR